PLTVLGLVLLAVGGIQYVLWGIFLRTVVGLHVTWLVNSATHMWGSQRFLTGDTSKNSFWVAVLTFGEGWHNNHHAHPQSAQHGRAFRTMVERYPLEKANEAYARMMSGRAEFRVVLTT